MRAAVTCTLRLWAAAILVGGCGEQPEPQAENALAAEQPTPSHAAQIVRPETQTTVTALLAGEHEVGSDVLVEALVVRDYFVRLENGARPRDFALAIRAEAAFFDRVAALREEIDAFFEIDMPRAPKAIKSQGGTVLIVASGERLIRSAQALRPEHSDLVAIELAGNLSGVTWEAQSSSAARSPKQSDVPWLTDDGRKWALDSYPIERMPPHGVTIEGAIERMTALIEASPPEVTQTLPNLDWIATTGLRPAEIGQFNRAVRLVNIEINRRRAYGVQQLAAALKRIQGQLEGLTGTTPVSIFARVVNGTNDASTAFRDIFDAAPPVYLREHPGPNALADQLEQGRRLLIASYPDRAVVSLEGETIGATPLLTPIVPSGATLKLAIVKNGYRRLDVPIAVERSPLAIQPFEVLLEAQAKEL